MSKKSYNTSGNNNSKYNENNENNEYNSVYSNANEINNINYNTSGYNYSARNKSSDSGNGNSNNELYYSDRDSNKDNEESESSSISSSLSSSDNSPINRYIKSLNFDNKDIHLSPPDKIHNTKNTNKADKADKVKVNKLNVNKLNVNKLNKKSNSKQSNSKKSKDIQNVLSPPYDSDWFETESENKNILSLEMYLKRLFIIARDNLQCNLNKDTTKAILVPHAGIKYSGLCAASAYYELRNRTTAIKRIILLCANHQSNDIIGTSYSKIESYRIGKAKLSLDTNTMEKLKPYITIDNRKFEKEHSFFNQLPFIETIAADTLICPLLIGNIAFNPGNIQKIGSILQILRKLLQKDGNVLVCSSDLSHINGHFEHKINSYINENIRKTDGGILQVLYNLVDGVKGRNNKIDEMLYLQNSPACGITAIYLFGKLLCSLSNGSNNIQTDNHGSNSGGSNGSHNYDYKKLFYSRVSCYYTSLSRQYIDIFNFNNNQLNHILDIPNSTISSVSYAGVVFTTQSSIQNRKLRKIDMICSQYEKIALLGLAKEQLYYKLENNSGSSSNGIKMPDNLIRPISSPVFNLNLGVFVTLHQQGYLRGCIGTLETNNDEHSIESNVKKYVIEAALRDNRFSPVKMKDFNMLEFSITILNNMKPITLNDYFGSKFTLGYNGILIANGKKQGYFLPSVAPEFGYNKQELLEELCTNKMGNNTKECFRTSNVQLFYNEGLEFNTYI